MCISGVDFVICITHVHVNTNIKPPSLLALAAAYKGAKGSFQVNQND